METVEHRATQSLVDASQTESADSGSLKQISARTLIEQLVRKQFTGRLLLSFNEKRKKIWFYQGEIFRIQSNLASELIGYQMIQRNWINEDQLETLLSEQRTQNGGNETISLGQLVQARHGIHQNQLQELVFQQKVTSLLQSLLWNEGDYEFVELDLKSAPEAPFSFAELLEAVEFLLNPNSKGMNALVQRFSSWTPRSEALNLAEISLWSVLAACRKEEASGILSVRRHNKLLEIVVKNGLPLILYEGTFGSPRQTIVVRYASEEHEKFFVLQVLRLLSLSSGNAYFRLLGEAPHVLFRDLDSKQGTDSLQKGSVEKSFVGMADVPFELTAQYLVKPHNRLKQMFVNLLNRFRS